MCRALNYLSSVCVWQAMIKKLINHTPREPTKVMTSPTKSSHLKRFNICGMVSTASCECDTEVQTVNHVVLQRPILDLLTDCMA